MTLFQVAFRNIVRDRHNYLAYYLNCSFTVLIFFLFSSAAFHPALYAIQNGSTLSMALFAGNAIIYCFAILFIGYSSWSFLKARGRQLGVYAILGMAPGQMKKMLFQENLCIGMASIVTGAAAGLLLDGMFFKIIRNLLGEGTFGMYIPVMAFAVTVLLFLGLFLAVGTVTPRFVSGKKVLWLIQTEKSYAKELKFTAQKLVSLVLSGVGICLLLRERAENSMGDLWMPALLTCVMVFVFSAMVQGCALFFAWSRKRGTHLKGINLFADAEVSAAVKENGHMMALNGILLAMAFLSVTILISMKDNVLQEVENILPASYLYIEREGNQRAGEDINRLDEVLVDSGEAEKVSYELLAKKFEFGMIRQSDYNRIRDLQGKSKVHLRENEVLVLPGSIRNQKNIQIQRDFSGICEDLGIVLQKQGEEMQLVTITGGYRNVYVMSDSVWGIVAVDASKYGLDTETITAYHDQQWTGHLKTADMLEDMLAQDDLRYDYSYSFNTMGNYYEVEMLVKKLMLFVGISISVIFLAASVSMIYFRLYTTLDRERKKYKALCKLGFSYGEMKRTVARQTSAILLLPFASAAVMMWAGALLLESRTGAEIAGTAGKCTVVFTVMYLMFYLAVTMIYRRKLADE